MEIKLKEWLPGKGKYRVANIVETIYQRITEKLSDEAVEAPVVSSIPRPSAYLLANQRKNEIETQKAMATLLSRHDRWKAGGPL